MVARPFRCDPSLLRPLLEDRLEENAQAALAGHLETCETCRLGLERMAAESRWWGDARLLAGEATSSPVLDACEAGRDSLGFLEAASGSGQLGKIGLYEVVEVIGRGGMGVVLKAFDPHLGRFVAIKVLAPELATSATARRRFAREAQAAAAITHDSIVAIHAVDVTPAGLPYLVMQYVSGRSLQERLDRTGPLEVREVLRIGMQAASGLAAAHAVGLVHRDVKPANILLENCVERVKLTDFGLDRAADDASLTQSGVVAGTPQYMAPEQARGEPVDARADLFSLGSVLYALCTGRSPFRAETTMGVLRRVSEDTPRPIREVNPEIPDWLEGIVAKLQAKDPADRFASAAEVADLLGRCLAFLEQPDLPPPFVPERTPTPRPRRKARSWLVAAALSVLAITALGASSGTEVARLADYVVSVLRIKTPEGTLVIQVDDPDVKVRVDGEDVIFTGAGPQEVRLSLRAGPHRVEKRKGKVVKQDLITITRGGKETVRATFEPEPAHQEPGVDAAKPYRSMIEGADDATVKRLEQRIQALEGELQVRAPADPREEKLKKARARLAELTRKIRNASADPAVKLLEQRIKALEGELQTRVPADLLQEELKFARKRLAQVEQMTRSSSDPSRVQARRKVQSLEAQLAQRSGPGVVQTGRASLRIGSTATPTIVLAVSVAPDGKTLAAGCFDGTIRLWDLPSGEEKRVLKGHTFEVRSVAFSPDGRTLASAGGSYQRREEPGEAKLWDLSQGRVRHELVGHTGMVWSIAFSPDGATLATGSWDKTARLWDASTGRTRSVLEGHTGPIRCVAFSPWANFILRMSPMSGLGPTLATGSLDGDVKFWHNAPEQPHDGKAWSTYHASEFGVSCIAYSPTGPTLAISPWDHL